MSGGLDAELSRIMREVTQEGPTGECGTGTGPERAHSIPSPARNWDQRGNRAITPQDLSGAGTLTHQFLLAQPEALLG